MFEKKLLNFAVPLAYQVGLITQQVYCSTSRTDYSVT